MKHKTDFLIALIAAVLLLASCSAEASVNRPEQQINITQNNQNNAQGGAVENQNGLAPIKLGSGAH